MSNSADSSNCLFCVCAQKNISVRTHSWLCRWEMNHHTIVSGELTLNRLWRWIPRWLISWLPCTRQINEKLRMRREFLSNVTASQYTLGVCVCVSVGVCLGWVHGLGEVYCKINRSLPSGILRTWCFPLAWEPAELSPAHNIWGREVCSGIAPLRTENCSDQSNCQGGLYTMMDRWSTVT